MFGDERILAVIPARGGSKRIKKKNIVSLAGKPMIHWTIEAAKNCQCIDKILISTDCIEIKDVSEQAGIRVPFLRTEAEDDFSSVSEATLTALNQAEELWGEFDIVIQLMANCPLRGSDVINDAINQFLSDDRSSQISFFKYGWMNPWWAHTIKENVPNPIFEKAIKSRSQDLDRLYCPTGSVWISTTKALKKYKTFYSLNYKAHLIDWISALDIDEKDDLFMAEALFMMKKNT